MSRLKSGVRLDEEEELVVELEAELWAESNNLFDRLWGAICKLIAWCFGFKKNGYLVITNKRAVEVSNKKGLWIFNIGKDVKYVLPSSVKEVGYTKEGTCCGCFCQSYNLYYESFTQKTKILLTGYEEKDVQHIVDAFYNAIKR